MGQLFALVIAITILGDAHLARAEKAECRAIPGGSYGRSARRDPLLKCHLFTNKTQCLERFGQGYTEYSSSQLSRASCAWHHLQSQNLVETIRMSTWGTNIIQGKDARGPGQLNFRGSLCQLRLTAILPEDSLNKYGAYLSLQGGPYMTGYGSGFATDMADHRRETISLGCTILPSDTKRNCTVRLTPPAGYALDQRFINNSLYVDFFTVDKEQIRQLRTTQELTPNKRMYVDLVHQWKRCLATSSVDSKPKPKPKIAAETTTAITPLPTSQLINYTSVARAGNTLVSDQVVFGPTEYALLYNPDQRDAYFIVDYRTYVIKDVTGVDYEVTVGKQVPETSTLDGKNSSNSTAPKRRRTPLTVFFAKEPKDFYLGIDCDYDKTNKNGTTCIPPTRFRIKGTSVCEGFKCKGSVRGLDPKEQYFLWASYPRYFDPSNYKLTESVKKIRSPYTKEMVTVKVVAKEWNLGKVNLAPVRKVIPIAPVVN